SATGSRRQEQRCASSHPTAPTSTRLRRPSPASRPCSARQVREPSAACGASSASSSTSSSPRNAPTTSVRADMTQI
ncbi:hypothetical protein LTR94_037789, partial [Friedmanniomyces endolithicus]